jgi:6,7-dimethyl-8-ribityllumazine synthase
MATKGNKMLVLPQKELQVAGMKVVLVKTEWNSHITDALSEGCKRVLSLNGVTFKEVTVPGAIELTFAIHHMAETQLLPDAFIALGCIIKGDTPHFEYVCQSVTQGITLLNTQLKKPVIFGVLTVNTEDQALERLGGIQGHKGEEAAFTALKMMDWMKREIGN